MHTFFLTRPREVASRARATGTGAGTGIGRTRKGGTVEVQPNAGVIVAMVVDYFHEVEDGIEELPLRHPPKIVRSHGFRCPSRGRCDAEEVGSAGKVAPRDLYIFETPLQHDAPSFSQKYSVVSVHH